jgi:hypothetical protein
MAACIRLLQQAIQLARFSSPPISGTIQPVDQNKIGFGIARTARETR